MDARSANGQLIMLNTFCYLFFSDLSGTIPATAWLIKFQQPAAKERKTWKHCSKISFVTAEFGFRSDAWAKTLQRPPHPHQLALRHLLPLTSGLVGSTLRLLLCCPAFVEKPPAAFEGPTGGECFFLRVSFTYLFNMDNTVFIDYLLFCPLFLFVMLLIWLFGAFQC